jgi:hypothetical protein
MRTESASSSVEESGHVLTNSHCKCIPIYFYESIILNNIYAAAYLAKYINK